MTRRPPRSPLFPYPTLFRSWRVSDQNAAAQAQAQVHSAATRAPRPAPPMAVPVAAAMEAAAPQRRRQDMAPFEPIDDQEMAAFKLAVAAMQIGRAHV